MRRCLYIIIGITLLFASCGQQHDAEKTVKAFVESNAISPEEITNRHFADLGTTRHISDSLINLMRHRGAQLYRQDISYPAIPQGELYYLRMRFIYKGDTLQNTFYLNQGLTEVVAFK